MLFMPQYYESRVTRFYQTFLDAIRDYPEHSEGAFRWDQRTFHPDRNGVVRPISSLWAGVPGFLQIVLHVARLAETTRLLHTFRAYGSAGQLPGIAGQEESVL
jgi:hypothetical protein